MLYEAATRIKELKPWEKFWDMDLIGIKYGEEEDIVFFSILGRGGECYGIAGYEGYEGLNSFLMLTTQQSMNLSVEYAMFNQRNLTCYWGNRDELTDKQRKIIKDLGYSYRGKNQWLYFLSFEPGYYPYNLDSEEVVRLSEYFQDMELVLKYYDTNMKVDFEHGNMFLFSFGKDKKHGISESTHYHLRLFNLGICLSPMRSCLPIYRKHQCVMQSWKLIFRLWEQG